MRNMQRGRPRSWDAILAWGETEVSGQVRHVGRHIIDTG